MESIYLEEQRADQPTDVKLTGRQAAEVMRNVDAGLSDVWRVPDKRPPHGFAMVLATVVVFAAFFPWIGAAPAERRARRSPQPGGRSGGISTTVSVAGSMRATSRNRSHTTGVEGVKTKSGSRRPRRYSAKWPFQ